MDNYIDIKQYESKVDSVLFPNFRSLSVVNDSIFSLSIGSPALIFKNGRVVYKEFGDSVFMTQCHSGMKLKVLLWVTL